MRRLKQLGLIILSVFFSAVIGCGDLSMDSGVGIDGHDIGVDPNDIRADTDGPVGPARLWPPTTWPPQLESDEVCNQINDEGGTFEFHEATIVVPENGISNTTDVCMKRNLVEVDGYELVGYVWGPHGMPIDPVATLQIRVPLEWIPPDVGDPRDVALYTLRSGKYVQLDPDPPPPDVTDTHVFLEAELPSFGTVLVGFSPIPSP